MQISIHEKLTYFISVSQKCRLNSHVIYCVFNWHIKYLQFMQDRMYFYIFISIYDEHSFLYAIWSVFCSNLSNPLFEEHIKLLLRIYLHLIRTITLYCLNGIKKHYQYYLWFKYIEFCILKRTNLKHVRMVTHSRVSFNTM